MLSKEYLEAYNDHKDELRNILSEVHKSLEYIDIVKAIVKCVLNNAKPNAKYDYNHITVIDDGDYQGSYIFAIPKMTYQPAPFEYIFAYAYYGSCSGCDALQAAQCGNTAECIDDIMKIALDIFESMKFLWSYEEG